MAGCVFAVSFNSSSVPSKQILEMEKPRAWSASSKTARAAGYFSASSFPMPGYCEPCPGNTNATLPIRCSSLRSSRLCVKLGELLLDFFVHTRFGQPRGHAYGIFHCIDIGTAMSDDAHSANAQQRRATIFRVIHGLFDALEGSFGKNIAELRGPGTLVRLAEKLHDLHGQTLANLQRDVADKTVANDHIDFAGKQIAAFHVADEVYR